MNLFRKTRPLAEIIDAQAHRLPVTRAEAKRISDHWDRCTERTIRDNERYDAWIKCGRCWQEIDRAPCAYCSADGAR